LERGTFESDIRVREHIRKICCYAIRVIDQQAGHHPHQVTPFRPSSCARRRFPAPARFMWQKQTYIKKP
jgi:hypothetical protein